MSKRIITRLWIAGLIVFALGLVTAGVGVGVMLAYGGHFTASDNGNGFRFVPSLDDVFWTSVSVIATGGAIAIAGGIVQLAAWVGALVNTNRLQDKTWFIVLLVGGILGLTFSAGLLGFAAMIAYLVGGPDGTQSGQEPNAAPADLRPGTFASVG